jgi:acetyl esterase/lipase
MNIWNKPLAEVRSSMAAIKTKKSSGIVENTRQEIAGIPCEVFKPSVKKDNKVILYFHGGGFCMGIYNANREFAAKLAETAGRDLYMPDYRLAPENPYPAALEDVKAIYRGLSQNTIAADNIIVMGDSSGSALALSALLQLKHDGGKMPASMSFITPVFDLAGKGDTIITRAEKDPFKMRDPLWAAKIYVGNNDPLSPLFSPLYGNLEGLPPIKIHAADYDVFLSDSCRFAEKVNQAGVKVELKIWKEMWHTFHMQAPFVPESALALKEICD